MVIAQRVLVSWYENNNIESEKKYQYLIFISDTSQLWILENGQFKDKAAIWQSTDEWNITTKGEFVYIEKISFFESTTENQGNDNALHSAAFWQILVHWGLDKPLLKIHGVLINQKM